MDFFIIKVRPFFRSRMNYYTSVPKTLFGCITGKVGFSDMAGPVGIVGMMSEVAATSPTFWDAVLNLLYFGGFLAVGCAAGAAVPGQTGTAAAKRPLCCATHCIKAALLYDFAGVCL